MVSNGVAVLRYLRLPVGPSHDAGNGRVQENGECRQRGAVSIVAFTRLRSFTVIPTKFASCDAHVDAAAKAGEMWQSRWRRVLVLAASRWGVLLEGFLHAHVVLAQVDHLASPG
jgi:hypothetical protein